MNDGPIKLKIQLTVQGLEEIRDLNGVEFIFGRSSSSTVCLNDPAFSRSHFKIYSHEGRLLIVDLKSSNGTFINNKEIGPENPRELLKNDSIRVHNSETVIAILDFEIGGLAPKNTLSPMTNNSFDLSDFSQQLIAVANEKVDQLLLEANFKAKKIVEDAIEKIKIDEDLFLQRIQKSEIESINKTEIQIKNLHASCEKEITQKKAQSERELAQFISIGKEKGLQEIEKYKSEKLEVVNQRILEENTKLAIDLESAKQKQAEQLKQMEAILSQRGNDLNELEKKFKSNFDKQNFEIEAKLEEKKKELITAEVEFDQLKERQAQLLEAHLESKKIEGEKKLFEIESKTKSTREEFENLYIQYDLQKKSQIEELEKIENDKKNYTEELQGLIKNITEKKKTYEVISSEHELSVLKLEEVSSKLQRSTADYAEALRLVESADFKLNELQSNYQKMSSELNEFADKKIMLSNEIQSLQSELNALKNKIAQTSEESTRFLAEQEKEIAAIKNKFLQEKAKLDDDMRKLKESEEKRLQELVTAELSKINKLKEDSLKLILELEDSITKELSHSTSKVFANSVGVAKFKEIAPEYEKSIRDSLQSGVLKLLKNELTATETSKAKKLSTNKSIKPMLIGATVSAFVFGVIPFSLRYIKEQNDPIKQQLENEARRAAVPVKKFIPTKVDTLGSNFVRSVVFTNNYYETVAEEKFRSELIKEGSVYLYKQWQIEEEKSIQSFAMIFSMIDAIHGRIDKIDPDNEKSDFDKLDKLEKETMKKLETILGNEVRLEAALKFQTRFYQEYITRKK